MNPNVRATYKAR